MTTIKELRQWLDTCERNLGYSLEDRTIFVDEDGLTLRIQTDGPEMYLELGGERREIGDFDLLDSTLDTVDPYGRMS